MYGAGTKVSVNGGSITGGMQGVSVQSGVHLDAADLITTVVLMGVEVKDELLSPPKQLQPAELLEGCHCNYMGCAGAFPQQC